MSALRQTSTLGIFQRMVPNRLLHLAREAKLDLEKHDTHAKRAVALTELIYRDQKIHPLARKRFDEALQK